MLCWVLYQGTEEGLGWTLEAHLEDTPKGINRSDFKGRRVYRKSCRGEGTQVGAEASHGRSGSCDQPASRPRGAQEGKVLQGAERALQ